MRKETIKQFEMIRETDPELFKDKLNETMKRLKDQKPEAKIGIEGDTLDALIAYEEPISIEDREPQDAGVKFVCEECPMFKPNTKADGTPDMRSKYGSCPHATMHRTWRTSSACEFLYQMIKNGDIILALKEADPESTAMYVRLNPGVEVNEL